MLLLMDEVFDLKERNQWLRRNIKNLLQQLIRATYGDTINRYHTHTHTRVTHNLSLSLSLFLPLSLSLCLSLSLFVWSLFCRKIVDPVEDRKSVV